MAAPAEERFAKVGEIELCYDELGDPDGEPMLLVMGLGTQLIHWDPRFCAELGERGFRVIRFDNRDVGRSSTIDAPAPSRAAMMLGIPRGLAYSLDDMADDAVGLLGVLELESAHLTGISMGGMITQVAGYRHPERVRSLALLSTSSGNRVTSFPKLRAMATLLAKPARTRSEFIDNTMRTFEVIGSPDHPRDPEDEREFREVLGATWDRGHESAGVARQFHAITCSGDRRKRLHGVRAPTVVVHGDADPLVRPIAGRSVARAIPGAELRVFPGMGHDMPPALFGKIADAIAANARRSPEGVGSDTDEPATATARA
jgi:pimeloyl-ACP methyl ester carboxylesterase